MFTANSGDVAISILSNPQLHYVSAALVLEECVISCLAQLTGMKMPASFAKHLWPNMATCTDVLVDATIQALAVELIESRDLGFEFALIDSHVICFVLAVDAV